MRFFIVSGLLAIAGVIGLGAVAWEILLMIDGGIISDRRVGSLGALAFGALILLGLAAIIELLWMLTGKAKADQEKRDPSA